MNTFYAQKNCFNNYQKELKTKINTHIKETSKQQKELITQLMDLHSTFITDVVDSFKTPLQDETEVLNNENELPSQKSENLSEETVEDLDDDQNHNHLID